MFLEKKLSKLSILSLLAPSLLSLVFFYSLSARLFNINYNSPFNDEAIYIVIGKLGIFQGNWWSYNAASWLAGLPYVYPVFTALAYVSGGIIGSRLLSVIFGIICTEAIFVLALMLSKESYWEQYTAGVIAAAVFAGAPVSLYVSRLATYDICSFCFFLLGLVFLLGAEKNDQNIGKVYFLSIVFFFFSFLAKIITAIYFPLVVLYSFLKAKKINKAHLFYWKRYFMLPLIIFSVIYGLNSLPGLLTYTQSQLVRERLDFSLIFAEIWKNTTYLWILWGLGSLGMLLVKQWQKWLSLNLAAFWILIFHLSLKRYWTLDKHLFLTASFFSLIIGIGISNLIWLAKSRAVRIASTIFSAFIILSFWRVSYLEAQKYNSKWENAGEMLSYLASTVNNGDKVLAEVGAAAILATYEKNQPSNTTTFDWFKYGKQEGEVAYAKAARDGYFNIIELEGDNKPKESWHKKISNLIRENLEDNYTLVWSKNGFNIYKRNF